MEAVHTDFKLETFNSIVVHMQKSLSSLSEDSNF